MGVEGKNRSGIMDTQSEIIAYSKVRDDKSQ